MLPGVSVAAALLASGAAVSINPVTLANRSVTSSTDSATTATASFTVRTDRTIQDHNGSTIQTWLDAAYSSANYQVRVTHSSGNAPSGDSLGTWLSLSSNRSWSLTDAAGASGALSCELVVEIRDAASPNTIRGTASYTIYADSATAAPPPAGVNWADIYGSVMATTATFSEENSDQTITTAGTLSFSYSLATGLSVSVIKNGSALGQVASTSVQVGDTIRFRATNSSAVYTTRYGTITVSGAHSDSIGVTMVRDSGA